MKRYVIYARLGVGIMLTVFWGLVDSPLLGVVFILALTALSAVRYRFAPYRVLAALEIIICVIYAFVWLPAVLGIWLTVIGLLEDRWQKTEQELLHMDFEDRAERFELENNREILERDTQNAARIAEIAERTRIAQDIHDHVGHEISGALIALRTAIKLYEKNDGRTGELLNQTAVRLESASERLRETVHNLKPARTPGVEMLKELCEAFDFCPVKFMQIGNLEKFAHWELLAVNLKEMLTNAGRHSGADLVTVNLAGNADYIRLVVTDNGKTKKPFKPGLGLSGMKERVRVAGGTLSINQSNGFQTICILPKIKGNEDSNEAINS